LFVRLKFFAAINEAIMLKRHEDALAQRIDTVAWKGFSFIEWWELKSWYEKDRIGKGIWRDLYDRFKEIADDNEAELYLYQSDSGVMLLHSDGLNKIPSTGVWEGVSGDKKQENNDDE